MIMTTKTNNIDYQTTYEGKELSGDIFNSLFQDVNFIKLTNESENHNGYQFTDGINIDTNIFLPAGSCKCGGIYFIKEQDAHIWLNYDHTIGSMRYMRKVIIPYDARVYVENNKFKADKIFLCPREKIKRNIWFDGIENKTVTLAHLPDDMIDREMCKFAVDHNWHHI